MPGRVRLADRGCDVTRHAQDRILFCFVEWGGFLGSSDSQAPLRQTGSIPRWSCSDCSLAGVLGRPVCSQCEWDTLGQLRYLGLQDAHPSNEAVGLE